MTGKTHISVGLAATMLVTKPSTIKELVLCLGVAFIGSVISDIDVSTSESREKLDMILGMVLITAVAVAFVEYRWHVGIVSSFKNNSNFERLFLGAVAFLGICALGKERPHRSFMHSILGVVLLSFAAYIVLPDAVPYLAVSMASHIIIDTLNRKKVLIFYPLPWGVRFGVCHSHGIVNNTIFKIASLVAFFEFLFFTGKIGVLFWG